MKTTLILPCYNEAASLPDLIERCQSIFAQTPIEVLLVDNGSTDNTPEIMQSLPPEGCVRFLRVPVNKGYGWGILSGLKAARTPLLAWSHADLQTCPKDVLKAHACLMSSSSPEKTFVKGLRQGRPFADAFFTIGMSAFESVLLGTPLWDINAQPVLFHRDFFESWQAPPHDFALDLYALHRASRQGLDIKRIPVRFEARQHGQSHWNVDWASKWRFIRRTVQYSIALRQQHRTTSVKI